MQIVHLIMSSEGICFQTVNSFPLWNAYIHLYIVHYTVFVNWALKIENIIPEVLICCILIAFTLISRKYIDIGNIKSPGRFLDWQCGTRLKRPKALVETFGRYQKSWSASNIRDDARKHVIDPSKITLCKQMDYLWVLQGILVQSSSICVYLLKF